MEVTARTDADRKGGHLAQAADGRLVLRESAQCPAADMDAFQDITRHRYFNTNNVWLALRPLRDLLAQHGGFLPLPIIVNRKTVDVRDATSPAVIQLESAMGAAIGLMAGAQAVAVPRTRFMPVKNCQDLLVLRSDCFMVNADYHVVQVDDTPLPIVMLDQRYYRVIADFAQRVAAGIPSLRHCHSLTVQGDITFAPDIVMHGDIVLSAEHAVTLPAGAQFHTGTHHVQ
jgi:UTP--glucose-1-phosphate uridylyltransferase